MIYCAVFTNAGGSIAISLKKEPLDTLYPRLASLLWILMMALETVPHSLVFGLGFLIHLIQASSGVRDLLLSRQVHNHEV